jgi:2-polyprenyl-3-methyl-5-hydroxy-6-metoxy-1,4-benzoquinol methylase
MRIRSTLGRIKRLASLRTWEYYPTHEWDRQYATSTWTYLSGIEQLPRYAVIEGWRRRFKPEGSVLDLGCGEGVLFEQIPAAERVDYTGVDLSQVAIDAASRKVRDTALERFICADLVTFEPTRRAAFDVIVFNEVLYYLEDPIAVVDRYRAVLARGGLIIVSVFHENLKTWKSVSTLLASQCLQTTVVHDVSSGKRWHLGLYQERPRQP